MTYTARAILQIDAEIAERCPLRTGTNQLTYLPTTSSGSSPTLSVTDPPETVTNPPID